jgi:uncharacterized protein YjiK
LRLIIPACIVFLAVACSNEAPPPAAAAPAAAPEAEDFRQWALPDKLREISGLALTSDERLLAVTDEQAIVYELDYETGKLVKAFALGRPVVSGDFEGIAVLNDVVWLMTSKGELFAAREGENGERVEYDYYDTKLGKQCELEGLAEVTSRNSVALICKEARKKKKQRVFEWSLVNGSFEQIAEFDLPAKAMEDAVGKKKVRPSGLTMNPDTGNWIVVAARQHAVFEVGGDGEFIDVIMRLDPDRHRQAEGIAVTRDGRLIIADEAGNGRARLSVYPTITGNKKN